LSRSGAVESNRQRSSAAPRRVLRTPARSADCAQTPPATRRASLATTCVPAGPSGRPLPKGSYSYAPTVRHVRPVCLEALGVTLTISVGLGGIFHRVLLAPLRGGATLGLPPAGPRPTGPPRLPRPMSLLRSRSSRRHPV
jgi:hypothetical protein